MNWFKVMEGSRRSASGLEWKIWRKLPHITVIGSVVPALVWAALYLTLDPEASEAQARWLLTAGYVVAGVVIFHWTMVLTLAIACAIVIVMKGPAYVADAYPLSHSDKPRVDLP
jgi:hypothetical protein